MSGEDGAERTQEATPKRRDDALRDGRVLVAKDVGVLVTLAAGLLALQGLATLAPVAAELWQRRLIAETGDRFAAAARAALLDALVAVLVAGAAIAVPVLAAAIAAQAAVGGLHWIPGNLGFRGSRIDPMAGLKRMVSAQALGELAKSLLKVLLLAAVLYAVAVGALPALVALPQMPLGAAVQAVADLAFRLLWAMTGVLVLVAGVDYALQRRQHMQSLRMTLDEVRRELREENGAPELKARQRQQQHQAARRGARERAALADVPAATVIVTNPRHFAVALRYVAGETAAPVIAARGTDLLAARIVASGRAAGVPVLPLPPLARALYFTGEIGRPIPEGLYGAVAAVLAHLWRLERGLQDELAEVDLPPGMRFTPEGWRAG